MNHSQSASAQKSSIVNGVGRRRIDKSDVSRPDNYEWRGVLRTSSNSSLRGVNKGIHERLLYMHTCLIGQHVEVQKVDGHVYAGIFHAAVMDNEFGVMLKMARLTRDSAGSVHGDSVREAARKPPIKTYVIQGKDFVQIIARDVSLSGDAVSNSRSQDNRSDILTDTVLSQGWHRETERELMPWKADDSSAGDLSFNLTNTWSRNWDQFEANKALFGVETSFDEELYTTKLIRGPEMREREREAQRIAREIVGQQTRNTHLAEERGLYVTSELDLMDEETKYSAVGRANKDAGDDDEDQHVDDLNEETFGGSVVLICSSVSQGSSLSTPFSGQSDGQESSIVSADAQIVGRAGGPENLFEHQQLLLDRVDGDNPDCSSEPCKDHSRLRKLLVGDKIITCNKGSGSSLSSPIGRCSPLTSSFVGDPAGFKALNLDPSCPQVPDDVYREFKEFKQQKQLEALKALSESFKDLEPRSPRTAVLLAESSASKKSPLNLYAKEFKLNPNAKAFTPSSCSVRPISAAPLPVVVQGPMFLQSPASATTAVSSSHMKLQTVAQPNQFSQYSNSVASAGVGANPIPYLQSSGVAVPGFPIGGVGGGGIIPGQPSIRISPSSQPQAVSSYVHPHQVKYPSPPSTLQPGFLHPNGQLYSQHMMYGQPANPVVFVPYPQSMMQGHPVTSLGQGHLCSQSQQSQPRSRRQGDMSA
ncbi:hypothetical protein KC19_VG143000 [Ceratodon purpureus]|uniref:LsmAD domain-containing protein n=1 Tax=Ceratodon purpureus TaxID=3225 RepID=A0A8T0HQ53_CERPU|nr:hypothetical protein KC19_VG143000 [Ceratodon purpureus]